MTPDLIAWPVKRRELHNHHFDSTVWNDFRFRDDDIVIATYAKSGTTWVQQIVSQLLFGGAEDLDVATMSPWLDFRVPKKDERLAVAEAQTHRRFFKTHLPVDALVYSSHAKYIYIGRDGRDVVWSMHNHHFNATDEWYEVLNNAPGRVGPPINRATADVRQYFLDWMEKDGHPFWPFWESIRSWWEIRSLPNLFLLHFEDLKRDMPGSIARIAAFLDIDVPPQKWPAIIEHCSFAYMRANGAKTVPDGGASWNGGAQTFLHKGTSGQWRDTLTPGDCVHYETMAKHELGIDGARWLATGRRPA